MGLTELHLIDATMHEVHVSATIRVKLQNQCIFDWKSEYGKPTGWAQHCMSIQIFACIFYDTLCLEGLNKTLYSSHYL